MVQDRAQPQRGVERPSRYKGQVSFTIFLISGSILSFQACVPWK